MTSFPSISGPAITLASLIALCGFTQGAVAQDFQAQARQAREQAAKLVKQMPPRLQENLEWQDSSQRQQFELWAAHGSKAPKHLASAIDDSRRNIKQLERDVQRDLEAVQNADQRLKDSIAANERRALQDNARNTMSDARWELALRLITLGNKYESHDAMLAIQKRKTGQVASAAQPTNRAPTPSSATAPSPPSTRTGTALTISDLTPAERKDVERAVARERIQVNSRTTDLDRVNPQIKDRMLAIHYSWLLTGAKRYFDSLQHQAELVRENREALTRGTQTTELQNSLHWARVRLIANDQILDMYIAELRRWAASHPEIADKQRLVPSNSKPFVFPQAGQAGRLFSLPGRKLTIPTAPPIHVVDAGLPAYRLWRDCLHARTGGPNPESRDRVHCQDLDPKGRREFDADLAIFGQR